MPDASQVYPIEFRGGLVTNLSPIQQGINAPGSARQLRNFEPSVEGGYRRISGYEKYSDSEVTGTNLIRNVLYYNGKVLAIRNNTGGGQGELYEGTGATWTRVSTDSIRFSASNTKVRYTKYNFDGTEKVMFVDGANYPIYYDGTTISVLPISTTYENARHITVYKDHIFLAKDTSVVFSAPLDETDWTPASGAGEISFKDTITGMQVFRDQLYVFTRTQIHRISGSTISDFQRTPVSIDLGCVREDTIQEIAGDIIFMGPDGLRMLSGTDKIGDVGLATVTKNIQSEVTKLLDENTEYCSLVIRGKSQYRVFGYKSLLPKAQAKGLIGTQFAEGMAWAEARGLKAFSAYSEYHDNEELIFFGNEDGYIYQMERGISFDGDEIDASFFTPFIPINDPTLRKTLYVTHNYIDPEGSFNTQMSINFDFGSGIPGNPIDLTNNVTSDGSFGFYGSGTYGTSIYGTVAQAQIRSQVTGSGFLISLEYTSTDTTVPFSLDSVALEYANTSRR